jgi:hypothetical protein
MVLLNYILMNDTKALITFLKLNLHHLQLTKPVNYLLSSHPYTLINIHPLILTACHLLTPEQG